MRHRRTVRKLGRTSSHRQALIGNLATALLEHYQIRTTYSRARALRPIVERLITLGKAGNLFARRQAARIIRNQLVLRKLFAEIAPQFRERSGGYSRILKVGNRRGDCACTAVVQLLLTKSQPVEKEKRKGEKPAKAKKTITGKPVKKANQKKESETRA